MANAGCVFCDLIRGGASGAANVVFETPDSLALVHYEQAFRGRSLVVIKGHVEDLADIPPDRLVGFNADMLRLARAVRRAFGADRMNYASFGNVVPHVHWHVIPRYRDDPLWGGPPLPSPDTGRADEATLAAVAAAIRGALP